MSKDLMEVDCLLTDLSLWTRQLSEQPPHRVAKGIAMAAEALHQRIRALKIKVQLAPEAAPQEVLDSRMVHSLPKGEPTPAAAAPFVMVPRIPTERMIEASMRCLNGLNLKGKPKKFKYYMRYRAMLSAAPQPERKP